MSSQFPWDNVDTSAPSSGGTQLEISPLCPPRSALCLPALENWTTGTRVVSLLDLTGTGYSATLKRKSRRTHSGERPEDCVPIGLRLFRRIQFVDQLCSDSIIPDLSIAMVDKDTWIFIGKEGSMTMNVLESYQ
ncbi:hypothetical protein K0M31_003967 [Melipona bicolor]|uniref:Uncharacterized protein n=1 Tax=Melipona bicolor TaxID=60889 RepID=A0AA40FYA6_9HYME|nr:hypothetical protein K0M31_003967 [Melipona bicolor]